MIEMPEATIITGQMQETLTGWIVTRFARSMFVHDNQPLLSSL